MPKRKSYIITIVLFSIVLFAIAGLLIVISRDKNDVTSTDNTGVSEQVATTDERRNEFNQSVNDVNQQLLNNNYVYTDENASALLQVIETKVFSKEEALAIEYANLIPDDSISSRVEQKYSLLMRLYALLDKQSEYTEYRSKLRNTMAARPNDEYAVRVLQNFDTAYPEQMAKGTPDEE
jgi:hypothetical protein